MFDDKLYLYGTDWMSNKDISDIYMGSRYPEMEIKWINDSSCVLAFKTPEEAKEALHNFTV